MTLYPLDTFMGKFGVDRRRPVKVFMMKIKELMTPYFRDEELKCTVVELNYKGNGTAMFILPDKGRMQQVEDSLQPQTLRKWKDYLRPGACPQDPELLMASVPVPHIFTYIQCNG